MSRYKQENYKLQVIGFVRENLALKLAKSEVKTDDPETCKTLTFPRYQPLFDNGHLCAKFIGEKNRNYTP